MTAKHVVLPFNSTLLKSDDGGKHYFCPYCEACYSLRKEIKRVNCSGGFFKNCPKEMHFHHKCKHCESTWLEATSLGIGVELQLTSALVIAERNGITEEDIVTEYRTLTVKRIHDS